MTDLVSLVRFAMHEENELVPFPERVNTSFKAWIAQQQQIRHSRESGNPDEPGFSDEQLNWLHMIRDHIAASLGIDTDDFDYAPFSGEGGLGKVHQLFGAELPVILEELNQGGVVSGIQELPLGWQFKPLNELASAIQYGYTAKSSQKAVGPKFLRITDIQDDSVNWDGVPFCKIESEKKGKYLLEKDDLVFTRTGATVGKSYLIRSPVPESVFASYLIRVRLTEVVDPTYVSYFFRASDYWRQISESAAGIGQPNVNGKKLGKVVIPVAPRDQQDRIVAEIEKQFSRLDEAVASLKRVKANLKRYKAAVLKATVEGKLTEECASKTPMSNPPENFSNASSPNAARNGKKPNSPR